MFTKYINSRSIYDVQKHLANLSNIEKAWVLLCLPLIGLLISPYFTYKALQDRAKTAIKLTYLIPLIALVEFAYVGWYKVDLILLVAIAFLLVGVYLYLIHTEQRHKTIMDVFGAINNYLASIGNKVARANQQISNAKVALQKVDAMNGDQFEDYMVKLLNTVGFKNVQHTPYSRDGGLDAVGYAPDGKTKIGWQFKHYTNGDMGYDAVEQTIAGSCLYNTNINYTLTSGNNITNDAKQNTAQINQNMGGNFVKLANRNDLYQMLKMNAKHLHYDNNLKLRTDNNQIVGRTFNL